jgi:hypothetical protein
MRSFLADQQYATIVNQVVPFRVHYFTLAASGVQKELKQQSFIRTASSEEAIQIRLGVDADLLFHVVGRILQRD